MHPDINRLLEVQRVDEGLARIQRDADSLPVEQVQRQRRVDRVRQDSELSQEELSKAEVESRGHEKAILAADEELKKLLGRLNVVKNNAEYQATLFQIESVKKEQGEVEEEGLVLLEKLDGLKEAAAKAAEQREQEESTFAVFQEEAKKMQASLERELEKVGKGRSDLIRDIPPDLLEMYTTIFGVRNSRAVCSVEGEVCTGCYSSVTPNDMARLLGASTIVRCGSCQRILYLIEG